MTKYLIGILKSINVAHFMSRVLFYEGALNGFGGADVTRTVRGRED